MKARPHIVGGLVQGCPRCANRYTLLIDEQLECGACRHRWRHPLAGTGDPRLREYRPRVAERIENVFEQARIREENEGGVRHHHDATTREPCAGCGTPTEQVWSTARVIGGWGWGAFRYLGRCCSRGCALDVAARRS